MKYQLNLIDPSLSPVAARPPLPVLLGAVLVAVLACAAHVAYERQQLAVALARPNADLVAGEAGEVAPDPVYDTRLRKIERDEALRDGLARATDLPSGSSHMLGQVVAVLPGSLWLTEIELSGKQGVRIAGGALDSAELAQFAARLSEVSALRGLALGSMQIEAQVLDDETPGGDAVQAPKPAPLRYSRFVLATGDNLKRE